jgi:hypothetical protein
MRGPSAQLVSGVHVCLASLIPSLPVTLVVFTVGGMGANLLSPAGSSSDTKMKLVLNNSVVALTSAKQTHHKDHSYSQFVTYNRYGTT